MNDKNPKALSVVRHPDQTDGQAVASAALNSAINVTLPLKSGVLSPC